MSDNELKKKIQKINVIGRKQLGLDNDLLHDFVYALTKKTSLRDLTIKDANLVISTMLKELMKTTKPKNNKIIWLMNERQAEKIQALGSEMAWGEDQLNKFSQRQYRKNLNQLTSRQAQSLIEALKAILHKQQNQGA
jgi:phage gp16-like protein